MTSLPEPDFIERDPATILQQVIAEWENETGLALDPTQPESLLLHVFAYRETLLRIGVQEAARANLLRWAKYPVIDYLGELLAGESGQRLGAQPAQATERFALAAAHGALVVIPAGTRVRSKDGRVVLSLDEAATIPIGQLYVDAVVTASDAGEQANGYLPGQVTTLVDTVPLISSVTNVTATSGGAPRESDERYLERLLYAADAASTAGSEVGYQFHARSASTAIADVVVRSPAPSDVELVILAVDGAPSPELLALVAAKVSATDVRPLTDSVTVVGATSAAWTIVAALWLYRDAESTGALSVALTAAQTYADARRHRLGRDAVLNQLRGVLCVPGVYDVVITSPVDTVVAGETEWLDCTSIEVTLGGTVDEDQPDG